MARFESIEPIELLICSGRVNIAKLTSGIHWRSKTLRLLVVIFIDACVWFDDGFS